MSNDFSQVAVEKIEFPQVVKDKFLAFAETFLNDKNPYEQFKDYKYVVATEMLNLLEEQAKIEGGDNSAKLLDYLNKIRNKEERKPIVISGLPVDREENLLASPTDPNNYSTDFTATGKKGYATEWCMTALCTIAGLKPRRDENIQRGNRFHHIVPRQGKAASHSNQGAEQFEWHTEAVYLKENDFNLILVALKNIETPTLLATTEQVLEHLRNEGLNDRDFQVMSEKRFKFKSGEAYNTGSAEYAGAMIKTTKKSEIHLRLNGNKEKIEALDPNDAEATQVIDKVAKALEKLNTGVVLEYGTMVVIPNRTAIHTRSVISEKDREQGKERHLVRVQAPHGKSTTEKFQHFSQNTEFTNKVKCRMLNEARESVISF